MATLHSMHSRTREQRDAQFMAFIQRAGPEIDPTSILLFRQVHRVNHLLTRSAERQLEIDGLSWPKFALLLALKGDETLGREGGLEPSQLSDIQGIPRNSVSTLLASLEEEGLVSRALHRTDRRRFVIRLTPLGRKTVRSKLGTQFRQLGKCFSVLSRDERESLLDLLTRLRQSLIEMNDGAEVAH